MVDSMNANECRGRVTFVQRRLRKGEIFQVISFKRLVVPFEFRFLFTGGIRLPPTMPPIFSSFQHNFPILSNILSHQDPLLHFTGLSEYLVSFHQILKNHF